MSREWGRGIIQSGGHCHPASHCHDVIHMCSNIITHHHHCVITGVITLAIRREDGKVSSIYSDHNMLLATNLCQARPGLSLTHAARWCFTGTQPPLSLHLVAWPPHPAIIYLTLGQTLTLHIGTKWPTRQTGTALDLMACPHPIYPPWSKGYHNKPRCSVLRVIFGICRPRVIILEEHQKWTRNFLKP